jgi:hypothetical protein
MFFHVDESGNTGNNLFDANQPRLSYALLSSRLNVDVLGTRLHRSMLKVLEQEGLHANALGVDRLTRIVHQLIELQEAMKFDLDYYFIDKPAYALVILFDAVFDAGLNAAVKWDSYWTPLRFVLIHKLSSLVDEDLLKEAWRLCIHKQIASQTGAIVSLLTELRSRATRSSLDARSIEIMVDAFTFGIAHPLDLDFGTGDEKLVSPNAVCFQFVVSAMAMRLRKKGIKKASSIVVDRQTQFNKAQVGTHYNLKMIAEGMRRASSADRERYLNHPLYVGIGADELVRRGVPNNEIQIRSSSQSIGLQIVDVYLWITNRMLTGGELSDELTYLGSSILKRSFIDGISMEGMAHRFHRFEELLPLEGSVTEEQREAARRDVELHREKVKSLGIYASTVPS